MIRVDFLVADTGKLKGFSIKGHAGYEMAGKDIVCAAVSSAAYMTTNTISEVIRADAQIEADEGDMYVSVAKKDIDACAVLLEGLKLHLQSLEEQYPGNINVFYLEV